MKAIALLLLLPLCALAQESRLRLIGTNVVDFSAVYQALLGGYSFVVPPGSPDGSTYKIELGRASGTSDGVSKEIFVQIPTNGSLTAGPINGTKQVTVGSRRYLVGDSAPFRWFNAGDFGESNLLNNDVLQIFQSAVYQINLPLGQRY